MVGVPKRHVTQCLQSFILSALCEYPHRLIPSRPMAGRGLEALPAAAGEQISAGGAPAQGGTALRKAVGEATGTGIQGQGAPQCLPRLRLCLQVRRCDTGRRQIQVLEAEYCAQQNIAPFLKYPALRKIVQTFTNDEHEDFGKWANNPLAIQMLQQARDLIESGRVTEAEMEAHLLSQLQASQRWESCAGRLVCRRLSSTAVLAGAGERGATAGRQQAGAHCAPGDRAARAGPERTCAPLRALASSS